MVSEQTVTNETTDLASALNAEALYSRLSGYAATLLTNTAPQQAPWQLVGIASGGVWLAERLGVEHKLPWGIISSTMHRDDFAQRGLGGTGGQAVQTQLPFAVTGANILLIDDVLYTGRTIRAALNELYDYGRPAKVRLAVLVDRGGRELPIAADFAAHTFAANALQAAQNLQLHLQGSVTTGKLHFALSSKE